MSLPLAKKDATAYLVKGSVTDPVDKNAQMDSWLDYAVSNPPLDIHSLSKDGQNLVGDVQEILKTLLALIQEKNGDQLIQEWIWAAREIDGQGFVAGVKANCADAVPEKAKVREDANAASQHLRSLVHLVLTNGEFRKLERAGDPALTNTIQQLRTILERFSGGKSLSFINDPFDALADAMGITIPKQPDISYHPDLEKYRLRTVRRLQLDPHLVHVPLPKNFPAQVQGPNVWEGKDWTNEEQWVYQLGEAQLKEIDEALEHFKGLNKPMGYIGRETFPLPSLGPVLWNLAQELYSGRGFFVIRTIPIDKYSTAELAIVYTGISSHVGSARGKQDSTGAVLAHIKDLAVSHAHEKGGIGNAAYTTDKQVFHTDIGDLIALLAIETSAEGGTSRISSGGRVYNEIAKTRPDLIHTLSQPWLLDSFGGNPGYTERPLLYNEDGHIVIQYSRRHFTGYNAQRRSPNIPPITEAQAEALDALHFNAEKFSLALNFQKGDIQYINSMGLLHARDAFRDDERHRRHLIRLWLRNDELAWKTPEVLAPIWRRLYSVPPEEQRFPLEPEIRRKENGATK